MLDQSFIAEQKKRLFELKKRLEADIQEHTVPVGRSHIASFPDYGSAEDENAMEVAQHVIDVDIQAKIESDLSAIERALAKTEEGTYGFCDVAGCSIPLERLKVMPEAVVCARHAI